MESLKIALHILYRAQEPSHQSLVGRESVQPPSFESRTLPIFQGWYLTTQPIPSLLILAYHNGSPFSPASTDEPGDELFREPIHKPTNCQLDAYKVFLGDLISRWPLQTIAIQRPCQAALA
jgi:hypothetical protein